VGDNVNVAILFVASRATDPVGFTQGAAQVNLKLAAPVIGAIGSLSVAVTAVLTDTSTALLSGVTAVTIGAGVTTTGTGAATPAPRMGSRLPLHPAARRPSSNAVNHAERLEWLLNGRIEACS
jgi:hypothetical protein